MVRHKKAHNGTSKCQRGKINECGVHKEGIIHYGILRTLFKGIKDTEGPASWKRQDDSRREKQTLLRQELRCCNFGLRVAINGKKRCFWFSRLVVGDALEAYMEKTKGTGQGRFQLSSRGLPVVQETSHERRGLYSLSENGNPVLQPQEEEINDVHFESIVDDVLLVVVPEEL